jgi:glutathione S-transferase
MIRLSPPSCMPEIDTSLTIVAPREKVLEAFFDPAALATWWQVARSVCMPRPLGTYVVEWEPTEWHDDVLGRLGGALHGTVMEYKPGRELFLADTYWTPPDGAPLGPMALEVTCSKSRWGTDLHLRQSGFEDDRRWRRYHEMMAAGWEQSLAALKAWLEQDGVD